MMKAQKTILLIVLALALTACAATMPAPPPRAQMPTLPEQSLLLQPAPAQDALLTIQVTQPTDAQAVALLAAQQELVDQLMMGVPMQAQPYIETYAAIEVARQQDTAEMMATTIALHEQAAQNVPPQVREVIYDYIDALKSPASQMPVRDQWYLEEQSYVLPVQKDALPELMATYPKSREVQAMDDLLKPATAPATGSAMEPYWENFFDRMENAESLPASMMPVRDQWYLDKETPATAPVKEPYWWFFFENHANGG